MLLSQGLREKGKISLFRKVFYEEFERYVKKALLMGSSLHRGSVGEPSGGSYTGTFERKRKCIYGFLSWTQRTLKLSGGHLEL